MAGITPLTGRPLGHVSIGNLSAFRDEDGDSWVSTICHFNLKSPDGGDDGPGASTTIGVKIEPDTSVNEASRLALRRAHELFQRLAAISPDDLIAMMEKPLTLKPLMLPEDKN